MKKLIIEVNKLAQGPVGEKVQQRLAEFEAIQSKGNEAWFEELCFCILAANARSRTSWAIQRELSYEGFMRAAPRDITVCILRNKHRFHNTKTKYLVAAREHAHIKDTVTNIIAERDIVAAREWLVENIFGFGYKEASHFLRNVGYFDFAILDRHIMNVMHEYDVLKEKPTSLTAKKYLETEKLFKDIAEKVDMHPGELDFYFWYMKTGEILK